MSRPQFKRLAGAGRILKEPSHGPPADLPGYSQLNSEVSEPAQETRKSSKETPPADQHELFRTPDTINWPQEDRPELEDVPDPHDRGVHVRALLQDGHLVALREVSE